MYAIECTSTGKFYIGSTTQKGNKRYNEHKCKLRKNKHSNSYLQNAWNKYGEESFQYYIIEKSCNVVASEQFYLDITKCYEKSIGYNLSKYAYIATKGRKYSQKERDAVRKRFKGKPSPLKGRKSPHSSKNARKMIEKNKKPVKCVDTGVIYPSVTMAAFCYRRNIATLVEALKKGTKCAGCNWEYVVKGGFNETI